MKRFYKQASVRAADDAFDVVLDERPIRTPGRAPLRVPTRMLAEAVDWYRTDLRLPLLPGLAIAITVLAFTLLGEAARDAVEPRTQALR